MNVNVCRMYMYTFVDVQCTCIHLLMYNVYVYICWCTIYMYTFVDVQYTCIHLLMYNVHVYICCWFMQSVNKEKQRWEVKISSIKLSVCVWNLFLQNPTYICLHSFYKLLCNIWLVYFAPSLQAFAKLNKDINMQK